jgi:hypothetical protein
MPAKVLLGQLLPYRRWSGERHSAAWTRCPPRQRSSIPSCGLCAVMCHLRSGHPVPELELGKYFIASADAAGPRDLHHRPQATLAVCADPLRAPDLRSWIEAAKKRLHHDREERRPATEGRGRVEQWQPQTESRAAPPQRQQVQQPLAALPIVRATDCSYQPYGGGARASAATTVEIWPDGADRAYGSGEVANRAGGCLSMKFHSQLLSRKV